MKKIIVFIISVFLIFSCQENTSTDQAKKRVLKQIEQQNKNAEEKQTDHATDQDTDQGEIVQDPENDPVYYDVKLKVISFNSDYVTSPDGKQIKKPVDGIGILLVKMTHEPYLYCELKTEEAYSRNFELSQEQWYNKNIGDVLYFDHIRKDRFFKINENETR